MIIRLSKEKVQRAVQGVVLHPSQHPSHDVPRSSSNAMEDTVSGEYSKLLEASPSIGMSMHETVLAVSSARSR